MLFLTFSYCLFLKHINQNKYLKYKNHQFIAVYNKKYATKFHLKFYRKKALIFNYKYGILTIKNKKLQFTKQKPKKLWQLKKFKMGWFFIFDKYRIVYDKNRFKVMKDNMLNENDLLGIERSNRFKKFRKNKKFRKFKKNKKFRKNKKVEVFVHQNLGRRGFKRRCKIRTLNKCK